MAAPTRNPTIRLRNQSRYTKSYEVSIIGKTVSTVVTKEALAVTAWIDEIKSITNRGCAGAHIIGLDVEWSRSNKDEDRNAIGILQLCVGTRCLIYQIFQRTTPIPPDLFEFLSYPHNMLVGVQIESKLEKLLEDYETGKIAPHLDLAEMSADQFSRPDLNRNPRMREVAKVVLGKSVEKPMMDVAACRWDKAELTEVEVLYATIDPVLAFEIGIALLEDFVA